MLWPSRFRCVRSFELQLDCLEYTQLVDHTYTQFRLAPCISGECLHLQADATIVIGLVYRYKFSLFHVGCDHVMRLLCFCVVLVPPMSVTLSFVRVSERYRGPGEPSRYSDSLRTGRSSDRIPEGARFPHLSRPDVGPSQHPVQCVPAHSRR